MAMLRSNRVNVILKVMFLLLYLKTTTYLLT